MQETHDNFDSGLITCAKKILDLLDQNPTPVILIDGQGASGKSTFAKLLQDEIFRETRLAPRVIHMDELYPGWDGLQAGSSYLHDVLLRPIAIRKVAHYQIWDWENGRRGSELEPGNGWREFSGGNLLIVEGCGSLSKANSELADLKIWISSDRTTRFSRWHERDQGKFDPYFVTWELQEQEFYKANDSELLADIKISN